MAKSQDARGYVWLQCTESGDLNYRVQKRLKGNPYKLELDASKDYTWEEICDRAVKSYMGYLRLKDRPTARVPPRAQMFGGRSVALRAHLPGGQCHAALPRGDHLRINPVTSPVSAPLWYNSVRNVAVSLCNMRPV